MLGQTHVGGLQLKVADSTGQGVQSFVELVSQVNEFKDTYSTDSEGNLTAKLLPFGIYQMRVRRQGFVTFVTSLEIRSSIPLKYRVTLSLAATSVAITVSGQDTLIDPHRVGDINRIGSQMIMNRGT